MRPVDAIIFDLDGTLIALSDSPRTGVLRRFWVVTETPLSYAMLLLDHTGLSRLLRPAIDRVRGWKGVRTLESMRAIEGTEALIARLAGSYRLAVATNRARREAHGFLEQSGLAGYISAVITREDVWRLKPHPAAALEAGRRLGVQPQRMMLVGDMQVDMQAARRAGAVAIGVTSGFCDEAELRAAGAECVLASVCELPSLLP